MYVGTYSYIDFEISSRRTRKKKTYREKIEKKENQNLYE